MIGLDSVESPVSISSTALKAINEELAKSLEPNLGVRIFVMIDRFTGFAFDIEFATPTNDDKVMTVDGINILVNNSFTEYVKGMEIDYDPEAHEYSIVNKAPQYNCVVGSKFECPSCLAYEDRKDDPKYNPAIKDEDIPHGEIKLL